MPFYVPEDWGVRRIPYEDKVPMRQGADETRCRYLRNGADVVNTHHDASCSRM